MPQYVKQVNVQVTLRQFLAAEAYLWCLLKNHVHRTSVPRLLLADMLHFHRRWIEWLAWHRNGKFHQFYHSKEVRGLYMETDPAFEQVQSILGHVSAEV